MTHELDVFFSCFCFLSLRRRQCCLCRRRRRRHFIFSSRPFFAAILRCCPLSIDFVTNKTISSFLFGCHFTKKDLKITRKHLFFLTRPSIFQKLDANDESSACCSFALVLARPSPGGPRRRPLLHRRLRGSGRARQRRRRKRFAAAHRQPQLEWRSSRCRRRWLDAADLGGPVVVVARRRFCCCCRCQLFSLFLPLLALPSLHGRRILRHSGTHHALRVGLLRHARPPEPGRAAEELRGRGGGAAAAEARRRRRGGSSCKPDAAPDAQAGVPRLEPGRDGGARRCRHLRVRG